MSSKSKRHSAVAKTERPLALDLPVDEPFFVANKNGPRPREEIPESVENHLEADSLYITLLLLAKKPEDRYVPFELWEFTYIQQGHLFVPHHEMERLRLEEKYGDDSVEYEAAWKERIRPIRKDHIAWGGSQYFDLWKAHPQHPSWYDRYEKLKADGYGDNWYAPDYSALPPLNPASLLPPPDARLPVKGSGEPPLLLAPLNSPS